MKGSSGQWIQKYQMAEGDRLLSQEVACPLSLKFRASIIYNLRKMSAGKQPCFLTVPRWNEFPFLIHGFGTEKWKDTNFKKRKEWKHFKLLHLEQVHSDFVQFISKVPDENVVGDAALTNLPYIFLSIKTADCLPLLMVDEARKVIAAVHCGWRGTQKRLVRRVIQGLKDRYGCRPQSLLAALGPSIGPRCYEVGEDVRQGFREEGFAAGIFRNHPLHRGKYLLDLREANVFEMRAMGVKDENIFVFDICPHCESGFPSFRRDGVKAGRMLTFIGMSF